MYPPRIFAFFKFTSRTLASIFHVALVWNRECPFSLSLSALPSLSVSLPPSRFFALIERVHSFLFLLSLFRDFTERCCHLFRENFARHDVRTTYVHLCECARARHRRYVSRDSRNYGMFLAKRTTGNASRYPDDLSVRPRRSPRIRRRNVRFSGTRLQANNIAICRIDNLSAS